MAVYFSIIVSTPIEKRYANSDCGKVAVYFSIIMIAFKHPGTRPRPTIALLALPLFGMPLRNLSLTYFHNSYH